MPTVKTPFPHKPRDQHWPLVNAMVARILSPKEAANDPKATAALEAEFEAQRKKRVWEEDKVEEWSTVCSRIRGEGKVAHVGWIFGIATIKNEELPDGHKDKKYKGRFVFQGSNVRDQDKHRAISRS